MKCTECKSDNPKGSKHCGQCGVALVETEEKTPWWQIALTILAAFFIVSALFG